MPAVPPGTLSPIGLEVFDQFLEGLGRQLVGGDHQHRVLRQARDRLEVGQQIVVQVLVDHAVGDMGADMADADRVAVGRRAHRLADGDRAGRARGVVDDELLAELLGHALADDARHQVGRPAGGKRHDHGDRLAGIGVRQRAAGDETRRQGARARFYAASFVLPFPTHSAPFEPRAFEHAKAPGDQTDRAATA